MVKAKYRGNKQAPGESVNQRLSVRGTDNAAHDVVTTLLILRYLLIFTALQVSGVLLTRTNWQGKFTIDFLIGS